ncbi:MAG: hypothetical protein FWG82_03495 [Oscillospiraceae bacterium]|nr:hypothetical protein [Oscillospiraceae bacterium]
MKKSYIVIISVVILLSLFVFVACKDLQPSDVTPKTTNRQDTVEVTEFISKLRSLESFTPQDVYDVVGEPDTRVGSGLSSDIYFLGDNSKVAVFCGVNHLAVRIYYENGEEEFITIGESSSDN